MMFHSYDVLGKFEKALVDLGIDTLPVGPARLPGQDDPYHELYKNQFREPLLTSVSSDLTQLFTASISLVYDTGCIRG